MRLQLTLLLCVSGLYASGLLTTVLFTSQARAQEVDPSVQASVLVYEDNDSTTVVTSDFNGVIPLGEDGDVVQVGYLADVVSSASVDVVSAATNRWTERRDEARASVSKAVGGFVLSGSYRGSWENDYRSHTLSLGGSKDNNDKSRTYNVGVGIVASTVGRRDDDNFEHKQEAYVLNLGLAQIVNRNTLLAIGYNLSVVDGYQSSPYRYVRIGNAAVAEKHPQLRQRHALIARLRRSIRDDLAIGLDQRIYADSWGLLATTTSLHASYAVTETIEVGLHNRFHYQGSAEFYQKEYMTTHRYMSSDRELSSLLNDHVGTSVEWRTEDLGPVNSLRLHATANFFAYRYFESSLIESRMGSTLGLGADLRF